MSDYETVWTGATHRTFHAPEREPARVVPVADRVASILAVITSKPQTIRDIARKANVTMRVAQPILAALAATGSLVAGKQDRSRTGRRENTYRVIA